MMIHLIGAGGVGSWMLPALIRVAGGAGIRVIDGDTLERKNLDRQLFDAADTGRSKAQALAERYSSDTGLVEFLNEWFYQTTDGIITGDLLIVAADNHAARRDALAVCDLWYCRGIFAANETHSAEAYYYHPKWRDSERDPREYYPEIKTDNAGDPRRAGIGCTGEAQASNPQLATANFMAAALALQLFVVWEMEAKKMEAAAIPHLPYKIASTLTRMTTTSGVQ